MAELISWDEFEEEYARTEVKSFSGMINGFDNVDEIFGSILTIFG